MKERSLLRRFRWIILIVVWGGAQLAGTAFLYHDSDLAMAGFIRYSPARLQFHREKDADKYLAEHPLPPAEGAEEILERVMFENNFTYVSFPSFVENESSVDVFDIACKAMQEFATLHAQRLAEKMVEEKLREELIKYDKNTWGHDDNIIAQTEVDEYLKSRER